MGTLISKNMAASSIIADLNESVTNSAAKAGKIAEIAAAEMLPVKLLVDELEADLAAAKKVASPLQATAAVAWQKACGTVRFVYDLTWNQLGRPGFDPNLSLLFPGGAGHYVDGAADKLPERMELLAQLFEKGIHPKLSKAQNQESADKVREAAKEHASALEASRVPVAKVVLLERTRTTLGQTAYGALSNFKRLMKAAGFTESQIHEVVPNRPPSPAKKAAPAAVAPAASAASAAPAPASAAPAPAAAAPTPAPEASSPS